MFFSGESVNRFLPASTFRLRLCPISDPVPVKAPVHAELAGSLLLMSQDEGPGAGTMAGGSLCGRTEGTRRELYRGSKCVPYTSCTDGRGYAEL